VNHLGLNPSARALRYLKPGRQREGFPVVGSNSSIRLIGWVAARESTSQNQANGSTAFRCTSR